LLGVGDLGLRALSGLFATVSELLDREPFDALFITIYPTYPALLGPVLKRRSGVPFVLDYQDPWVGAWGETVGGGPGGAPDLKSRLSHLLARALEPRVIAAADAITAVSSGTYEELRKRYPRVRSIPCAAIPLGGEPADFEHLWRHPRPNPHFDPMDGQFHLCSVGTLLPLGLETLRAVLKAAALLRERRPALGRLLRFYFFGTSNQRASDAPARVLPVAKELGLEDCVREVPPRIDYLDGLTVQTQASAILMMGSSERHYTASKLYPGLLAERPILAVYHEESSVAEILRRATRPPGTRLVTYGDRHRAGSRVEAICAEFEALMEDPSYNAASVDLGAVKEYSTESLAGNLAAVLEQVMRR
jgi:hypothetical protein